MALTVTSAWTKAMSRSGLRPVTLAAITIGADTFKALDAASASLAYPQSIAEVTPVSAQLDPWTRESGVSDCEILFHADGWAKKLLVENRLVGQKLQLKLGEHSLGESDYAPHFCGVIDKALPLRDGAVRMTVADALSFLRDVQITGNWFNMHPLDAMLDILERAGVPSSLIDTDSFDWANYTDWSHLVVSHGQFRSNFASVQQYVGDPQPALQLLNQLVTLCGGAVLIGEDGVMRYQDFDADGTVQATWSDDDIGDLEVHETDGNAVNSISVQFGQCYQSTYRRDEANSKAAFAYPGESTRIRSQRIDALSWIDGVSGLVGSNMKSSTPGAGSYFSVGGGGMVSAFSGTAGAGDGVQSTPQVLSTSRLAYLLVDREVISCNAVKIDHNELLNVIVIDVDTFPPAVDHLDQLGPYPVKASYRVKARGALSTSKTTHVANTGAAATEFARVVDITIPVRMVQQRLERWAFGVPIVEFSTTLSQHFVQVGDLVRLSTDQFFGYGREDLLDATLVWEVIGKECDPHAGKIRWTLAYATESTPPTKSYQDGFFVNDVNIGGHGPIAEDASSHQRYANNFVLDGFAATAAGLVVTIGTGVCTTGQHVWKHLKPYTYTVTNNKTTYFLLDLSTGAFVTKRTTSGTTEPTHSTTLLRLWKAVASGGAVVLTDLRTTVGLYGSQLGTGSVGTGAIATGAVGSAQIATSGVNTANLANAAVTNEKIAADTLNTEKFANGSVQNSKVAVSSVGVAATVAGSAKTTRNSTLSVLRNFK